MLRIGVEGEVKLLGDLSGSRAEVGNGTPLLGACTSFAWRVRVAPNGQALLPLPHALLPRPLMIFTRNF